MELTNPDGKPKTMGELREELVAHLKTYPDFESLIAAGMLVPVGGGWFEQGRGSLPEGAGKFMSIRVRAGKAQYKPMKLTKHLKALRDSS